jgi:hypothetical protein
MVLAYDSGLIYGVEDMLLKVAYLELFHIAVNTNTMMEDYLDYSLRHVTWSPRFIRLVQD